MKRYRITITGIVQGVGFRPFIYNLSTQSALNGWVSNTDSYLIIEVETNEKQLLDFVGKIRAAAPDLSHIETISYEELPLIGFTDFTIRHSQSESKGLIFISPDVSTCKECRQELFDKRDRRFLYPFINCTNCGPRFTIIKDIPYDRDKTTMNCFEMCDDCALEYTKPSDRRYHAQPVACHNCGPSIRIADENGELISSYETINECTEYITKVLKAGKIAAIKGIGGYHLACDALNERAVNRLRSRKNRDDKPFALMMKNPETVLKFCKVNEKELQLLKSSASPIVLLEIREEIKLPAQIAYLNRYLGVMLPYAPIHYIMFEQQGCPEVLVMTSGNLSSEPIFYKDTDAIAGLKGIADAFMINNREIYIRTDDSVTRVFDNKEYIIRRSRGYVPKPIKIDVHRSLGIEEDREIPSVLACGGELKNAFCINKHNLFYLSHHIGDLENESTNSSYITAIEHFKRLFNIYPESIAYDLHPNYFSSQYALKQDIESRIGVQHHKAHIASCMAENQLYGNVIGVAFDGTGYGEDGNIWGGEFFAGDYYDFERMGHLEYLLMPGGDSAVKHPWRMAVSCLYSMNAMNVLELLNETPFILKAKNQNEIAFTIKMLEKKLNCPKTSSAGRLFDAVSALLGIRADINYEGQAAVELEYYAVEKNALPYKIEFVSQDINNGSIKKSFIVKTSCIIKQIVDEILEGHSKEHISSRFHSTVAEIVLQSCEIIKANRGINIVVLSGGVFQNITLLKKCVDRLREEGFEVYTHSQYPSNDGGIALGQAMMALAEQMRFTL